jgi:hypothetical protein
LSYCIASLEKTVQGDARHWRQMTWKGVGQLPNIVRFGTFEAEENLANFYGSGVNFDSLYSRSQVMNQSKSHFLFRNFTCWWCLAMLLSACGGGGSGGATANGSDSSAPLATEGGTPVITKPPAIDSGTPVIMKPPPIDSGTPVVIPLPITSGTMTVQLGIGTSPAAVVPARVQPSFHALPVLLDEPDDQDSRDNRASVNRPPQRISIPGATAGLSTRRLTLHDIHARHNHFEAAGARRALSPMLAPAFASVYTPAQIRAAYGLPAVPPFGTTPTAAQAARMGAGQTIYILGAYHASNVAAELAAFNAKYGLPTCTKLDLPTTMQLPLAPAPTINPACTLSVVYATSDGSRSTQAPTYDAAWATEIAIDVQWSHAIAPLARIVLIEAVDEFQLLPAVLLANAMGPGTVSMSWGGSEGNWITASDSVFTTGGMTYLAAAGDDGAEVIWPAVSPHVVAVGGTTLSYVGSSGRSEFAWAGSGGGVSAYVPTPDYQTLNVSGLGPVAHRSVTDVSFNADPVTGQFIAVIPQGGTATSWMVIGGTSLATPEWAGIFTIANAMRAAAGKAPLGQPHALLYGMAATAAATYASVFSDITTGSNGNCVTCAAGIGYDQPTGLGTPNGTALLNFLAEVPPPLEMTPATIAGATGTPLSFTVSVNAANPVNYTLSGAPAGLGIDGSGVVTWPVPAVGSYGLTVTATDSQTKAQGMAVFNINVAAPTAPTVNAAKVFGMPGTALTFPIIYAAGALDALSFSLSGAPVGMEIGSRGAVSWPTPVLGSYSVTVTVKNSKTGLSGSATYTVKVQSTSPAPSYPLAGFTPMRAVAGKATAGTISFTAPGATTVTTDISGAPKGMNFFVRGLSLNASWAKPVTGSYPIRITAVDDTGRKSTATVVLVVTAQ